MEQIEKLQRRLIAENVIIRSRWDTVTGHHVAAHHRQFESMDRPVGCGIQKHSVSADLRREGPKHGFSSDMEMNVYRNWQVDPYLD